MFSSPLPHETLTGLSPSLASLSRDFNVFHTIVFVGDVLLQSKRTSPTLDPIKGGKDEKRPRPLSLTTTHGISVDFFSFSYLDVSIH